MFFSRDITLFLILAIPLFALAEVGLWRLGHIGQAIALFLLVGACTISFDIYTAIYPFDSFYKHEFTKITGYPFPASGRIKFKESSLPDIHGDYESCAVITVSENDYDELRRKIAVLSSERAEDQCMYHLWKSLAKGKLLAETSQCDNEKNECRYWALVEGSHEVVIHYDSW